MDKAYQDLAAYTKTKMLKPGETETVTASFALDELASYDEARAAYVLEKGEYLIRVGTSSADTVIPDSKIINLNLNTTKQSRNMHAA